MKGEMKGIWITDKDDNISFVDPGTEVIIGMEGGDLKGRNVLTDSDSNIADEFRSSYCEAKLKYKEMPYRLEGKSLSGGIFCSGGEVDSYCEGRKV